MKLRLALTSLLLALIACAGTFAEMITIQTVPVGNLGNPNDLSTGFGGVNSAYSIGKYEVTIGQYTAFLNAVAKTDTYGLWNASMASDHNIAGISRSGLQGSLTYSVIGSANHPVTYVGWAEAARFVNWLHNGQPTGTQNNLTTEDGAYFLNGAIADIPLLLVTRKPGATWFIPSENEWYKAAYYQPAAEGGDSDSYWLYPLKTNSAPFSDQPPGATPDNTRVANYYNNGYAVTGSTTFDSNQNYLTDVGAYTSSLNYYGTFDQGGNVWEWNDTVVPAVGGARGVRGGAWDGPSDAERATTRANMGFPTLQVDTVGFRVATNSVPEPSTVLAVSIVALLASCCRR